MYNRYTPRQDGGFHRDRVPEPSEPSSPRQNTAPPHGVPPTDHHTAQHSSRNDHGVQFPPSSASGFLSRLLPKNMDTGDLLMLLILLLLLTDGSEDAPDPLLTIALFFLME